MPEPNFVNRYVELVRSNLEPEEKIELIVQQSRLWPGVPLNSIFKPVIVFLTNERLIIVSRHWLGLLRNITIVPLTAIRTTRLEKGLILASIVVGQLGAAATASRDLDGFNYQDASALLRHITKSVHNIIKTAPKKRAIVGVPQIDRCYNCGEPLVEGSQYCYHCGVRLF
ncbi:MAG: PH domain-containing protein [Candidatus Micrarchaeota archaeon]|nr:PH domain-containing protein [Candidatus Micrarchaeota archaeon]